MLIHFLTRLNKLILLTLLGAILGRGFSKLQNLSELHFAKGKQDCDVIRADMFESLNRVKSLKYIDLSGLLIKKLGSRDAPVFKNLPYVETIILNGNPALGDVMWFTGNFWAEYIPSLKHLHLANVGIYKLIIDLLVHKLSGTKLKTLILDGNRITGINPGIHKGLPTLEVLSITENQMSSPVDLIAELLALPNLRYLNLSRQNLIMPKRSNRIRREEPPIWGMMCSRKENYTCVVRFPRYLMHLDLSYSGLQLPAIPRILMNNNSLQFVYLSSNSIRIMPKPFYCSFKNPPLIKLADLSNNNIECINSSYFSHCDWSSLNILNLSGNRFRKIYENECNQNVTYFLAFLRPIWNLTKLDLSGNIINSNLHFDSFEKQNLLEELYISKMGLKKFTTKISHMIRLKYLDISFNNLQCLSKQAMVELSNLSSIQNKRYNKTILRVNLNNNPLQCSCQCYPFLKWLKATEISFEQSNLTCTLDEVRYNLSTALNEVISTLEGICFPHIWFHAIIGVELTMIYLIFTLTMLRRHKFRLYFLYLQLRTMLISKIAVDDVKSFHAFISYASPDRQWVKKRLIRNLEETRKLKTLGSKSRF